MSLSAKKTSQILVLLISLSLISLLLISLSLIFLSLIFLSLISLSLISLSLISLSLIFLSFVLLSFVLLSLVFLSFVFLSLVLLSLVFCRKFLRSYFCDVAVWLYFRSQQIQWINFISFKFVTNRFLSDLKNLLLFDLIDLISRFDIVIYSDFLYLTFYIFLLFHQWISVFTIDSIITINQSLLSHHWLRNSISQINFCSLSICKSLFVLFQFVLHRSTSSVYLSAFFCFLIVWVFHLDSSTTNCICLSAC